jgi:hypothetical protein
MVAPYAHEAWFSDSGSETLSELISVVATAQKILVFPHPKTLDMARDEVHAAAAVVIPDVMSVALISAVLAAARADGGAGPGLWFLRVTSLTA